MPESLKLKDYSTLPVVSPQDQSQILGILTRKDILDAYDHAVIKKTVI
jgi:hypothetical protein